MNLPEKLYKLKAFNNNILLEKKNKHFQSSRESNGTSSNYCFTEHKGDIKWFGFT